MLSPGGWLSAVRWGSARWSLAGDVPGPLDQQDLDRVQLSLAQAARLAGRARRAAGARVSGPRHASSTICKPRRPWWPRSAVPHLGICLDVFHYYIGPSKAEDLVYLTAENLFHVQLCDLAGVARELATDADRILPGDGDFNLRTARRPAGRDRLPGMRFGRIDEPADLADPAAAGRRDRHDRPRQGCRSPPGVNRLARRKWDFPCFPRLSTDNNKWRHPVSSLAARRADATSSIVLGRGLPRAGGCGRARACPDRDRQSRVAPRVSTAPPDAEEFRALSSDADRSRGAGATSYRSLRATTTMVRAAPAKTTVTTITADTGRTGADRANPGYFFGGSYPIIWGVPYTPAFSPAYPAAVSWLPNPAPVAPIQQPVQPPRPTASTRPPAARPRPPALSSRREPASSLVLATRILSTRNIWRRSSDTSRHHGFAPTWRSPIFARGTRWSPSGNMRTRSRLFTAACGFAASGADLRFGSINSMVPIELPRSVTSRRWPRPSKPIRWMPICSLLWACSCSSTDNRTARGYSSRGWHSWAATKMAC